MDQENNIGMQYDHEKDESTPEAGMNYSTSMADEIVLIPAMKSTFYPNSPHDPHEWRLSTVGPNVHRMLSEARAGNGLNEVVPHLTGSLRGAGCLSKSRLLEFEKLGNELLAVNKKDRAAEAQAWKKLSQAVSSWRAKKYNAKED